MELNYFIRLFRRWLWLILLVSAIAGLSGYLLSSTSYTARALIAVGDYIHSPSPDRNDVLTGIQLAETYAVIATTPDIVHPAAEAVGIQIPNPGEIIHASVLPDTSILAIEVTHQNPALAAELANEISRQIIAQSRYLEIIEWADTPTSLEHPTPGEMAVIGAVLGASVVFGAILLSDYLDQSLHNPDEATQVLALPILGTIPRQRRGRVVNKAETKITKEDMGVFEQYRVLGTNILWSASQTDKRIFLITSTMPREGKSTIAANLAVAMARTNQNVLLIDADLRHPALHTVLGLQNDKGLIQLLQQKPPQVEPELKLINMDGAAAKVVQYTEIPKLRVIASGGTADEPGKLFGLQTVGAWMRTLLTASDVDVILVDTPPALAVSDVLDVASQIDGSVLLVVQAGKTSRQAILMLKERFQYLGITLHGVILNRVQGQALEKSYLAETRLRTVKLNRDREMEAAVRGMEARTPKPKRVLVIEDDKAILTLLEKILLRECYEVNTAVEGEAGITTALEWKPDLILLDVMLPDLNGYEICRRLKSARATAEIPVIFVTAKTTLEDKQQGFSAGGIDYLIKPFEPRELVLRVEAHLRSNLAVRSKNGK